LAKKLSFAACVSRLLCACNPFGPRALPIATSVPMLDGYVAARAEASPSGRPLGRWRERSVQGGAADGVGAGRSNVCAPPRQIRLRSCRNASLMRLAQRARSASHVARGRSLFPGNISRVVGGAPAAPTSDGGADRWPERGCAGIQGAALRTVILFARLRRRCFRPARRGCASRFRLRPALTPISERSLATRRSYPCLHLTSISEIQDVARDNSHRALFAERS
jgi:hypothetical protein